MSIVARFAGRRDGRATGLNTSFLAGGDHWRYRRGNLDEASSKSMNGDGKPGRRRCRSEAVRELMPGKTAMHRSDDRHALDSHAREKEIAQRLMAEDPSLSKDHAIAKARAIMRDEEKRRNGD